MKGIEGPGLDIHEASPEGTKIKKADEISKKIDPDDFTASQDQGAVDAGFFLNPLEENNEYEEELRNFIINAKKAYLARDGKEPDFKTMVLTLVRSEGHELVSKVFTDLAAAWIETGEDKKAAEKETAEVFEKYFNVEKVTTRANAPAAAPTPIIIDEEHYILKKFSLWDKYYHKNNIIGLQEIWHQVEKRGFNISDASYYLLKADPKLFFKYYYQSFGTIPYDHDAFFRDKVYAYNEKTLSEYDSSRFDSLEQEKEYYLNLIKRLPELSCGSEIERGVLLTYEKLYSFLGEALAFPLHLTLFEKTSYLFAIVLLVLSVAISFPDLNFSDEETLFFYSTRYVLLALILSGFTWQIHKYPDPSTPWGKFIFYVVYILWIFSYLLTVAGGIPFLITSFLIVFLTKQALITVGGSNKSEN